MNSIGLRSAPTWHFESPCLMCTVTFVPTSAHVQGARFGMRTLSLVAVCYCRRRAAALRTVRHRLPSGSGESPPQGVLLSSSFRSFCRPTILLVMTGPSHHTRLNKFDCHCARAGNFTGASFSRDRRSFLQFNRESSKSSSIGNPAEEELLQSTLVRTL